MKREFHGKRNLHTPKETYKRDLYTPKETYIHQKRPAYRKRDKSSQKKREFYRQNTLKGTFIHVLHV